MILLVGPFVAVVGLVAIFFVMRRKSVDKRSMYSARRSQIEHKVRAARQRTLAPHGHAEKPAEAAPAVPPAPTSTFAPKPSAPTITYQPAAYQPPPPAPAPPAQESGPSMWDVGASAPAPAEPSTPTYPQPEPEPYQPAPEATPKPGVVEEWTPGPAPAERVAPFEPPQPMEPPRPAAPPPPMEPVAPSRPGGSPAWSVVQEQHKGETAHTEAKSKSKDKAESPAGSWQLASGDTPGSEAADETAKRPSGSIVAVAQYAILVVGLVMVLIGVLVMVANSHVT
jgi:hypothetical protein